MLKKLVWLLIIITLLVPLATLVRADELEDIEKQLIEVRQLLDESKKATEPLEANLNQVEVSINNAELQIAQKQQDIVRGEADLVKQKEIISERARSYYKQSRGYLGNLLGIVLSKNLPEASRMFFYQQQSLQRDRDTIIKTAFFIRTLEEQRTKLEFLKKELDSEKVYFASEVAKAKDYQSGLEKQIAELSAKQQQLVAQRLASLNIPRSAGTSARGCSDDRSVDPGFSPRIAFFSFGAPHRVGLNQYGARGRAEAGQNRDQILSAYFQNYELTKWDTNTKIRVEGKGEFTLEEYVQHIYEMPEDWPMAALEAQVIAARSYALAYTNNGANEICTTESCQVFGDNPKTGQWAQAVTNTEGLVMTSGGSPIKAWYASTHGGYVFSSGEIWGGETSYTKHATDTTSGGAGSFSDLQSNAYDRSSPWFYCDWGARSQYNNTAWLKTSELADITNVILLARKDPSTGDYFYQTDKAHPYGGEVWNEERVKQELRSRGITPYNNVSGISIAADFGAGKTSGVTVSGDSGSVSFSGEEFKSWFNLRAPANLQIVGPLYNAEQQ